VWPLVVVLGVVVLLPVGRASEVPVAIGARVSDIPAIEPGISV